MAGQAGGCEGLDPGTVGSSKRAGRHRRGQSQVMPVAAGAARGEEQNRPQSPKETAIPLVP